LVSARDPSQAPPAGGGGDSLAPIISPDGRYVLFASLANNLMLNTNNLPIPVVFPSKLNVFLRDRTNLTTTLVSVNLSGLAGGNGDSIPTGISSNGQYVLFESSASDLVPGDTNSASDIFVRDLVADTTLLVSVSTNGGPANGASRGSVITPDGRYVAFVSEASNLVAGDTNRIADVFVRDMQAGVTTLVSAGATASSSPGGGASEFPDITPDGRYVAFYSTAANLVGGTVNSGDIYVRDLVGGTTTWASSGALTAVQSVMSATSVAAYNHVLSAAGQFVAYEASPSSLSAGLAGVILRYNVFSGLTDVVHTNAAVFSGPPESIRSLDMTPDGRFIAFLANTNGSPPKSSCVYVWDAQSGTTTLASGDLSNSVPANSICYGPSLDPSGRFVLFLSSAANLVTNALSGDYDVYVRDMQAGLTTLVDADTNGMGPAISMASAPQMTADGRFVFFECPDAGLVANDRNRDYDLFVRDVVGGTTEMISARDAALPTATPNGNSLLSAYSVSTDGSSVAFVSEADNLVSGDTNGWRDIFVWNALFGTNALVSIATNGFGADGMSMEPAISGDGRYVAFTSSADNLVAGDTNLAQDVFVRDLLAGTTVLVSTTSTGTGSGNGASYSPAISANGRYVLFRSLATNLAAGSFTSGYENLFVRDLQGGANYALTQTTSGSPVGAMTPDGRFVAFYGIIPGYAAKLYVWSSASARVVYSNALTGSLVNVAVSPDGNRIAYATALGPLSALDRISATSWAIGSFASSAHPGLRFSADGRFLAYATPPVPPLSGTNQVYLYDLQYSTNYLVSHAYKSAAGAYGASDWPEISSDGRFVAFRSAAPNIIPGDTNGVPDVFLYDRLSNTTTVLGTSLFGAATGESRSLAPVFSGDGQTLVFESWASDLVPQDFGQNSDLFACRLYSSGPIPLFYVEMLPAIGLAQRPWLSWPVVTGKTYAVQFKNTPQDANWQTLNGGMTILGDRACLNDLSAGASPRLYRVVSY
jgi:Tol biopolymer transport system component